MSRRTKIVLLVAVLTAAVLVVACRIVVGLGRLYDWHMLIPQR